jgi:hypothetical protein
VELAGVALPLQLLRHCPHRMRTQTRLDWPIRPEHQQARGDAAAGDIRQPVEGGIVTPVQVFQDQDEGTLCRQRFERLREFP